MAEDMAAALVQPAALEQVLLAHGAPPLQLVEWGGTAVELAPWEGRAASASNWSGPGRAGGRRRRSCCGQRVPRPWGVRPPCPWRGRPADRPGLPAAPLGDNPAPT
ncbi:hypothetical protein ACFQU7_21335 [Pseudoroseomonas wenyumeiae]